MDARRGTLYRYPDSNVPPWKPYALCAIINMPKLCILPTPRSYVFRTVQQTAIISLHSINWFVFVMDMDCVLWEVRTQSVNL